MNQAQIEQYLAGRMAKEEAEAFETYCVANPEFARQVEFEQRLRAGIREVGSGSSAEFVRSHHPRRAQFALAAGLVLVVTAGFFVWRHPGSVQHPLLGAVTEARHSGPTLRLALERGEHSVPRLPAGFVRIEIAGLFDTNAHYSVSLERIERQKSAETLATVYGQHPASPTALELMIDSDDLRPGAYSLRLRKQASDEEPLDFEFLKD